MAALAAPARSRDLGHPPLDVVIQFPYGPLYEEVEAELRSQQPKARARGFFDGDVDERTKVRNNILKRRELVQLIRAMGLYVRKVTTQAGGGEYYIKIGGNDDVLMNAAELMQLPMKMDHAADPRDRAAVFRCVRPFRKDQASSFLRASGPSFFDSTNRIRILQYLLEGPKIKGCAEIVFSDLIESGVVLQYFPLHDEGALESLAKKWFGWRWNPLAAMPIDECRNYLGEQVGFYFTFLDTYTRWLAIMALLGIATAAFQYTDRAPPVLVRDPATKMVTSIEPPSYDSWVTAPFCILVACAAALFSVYWTRVEARCRFEWGMRDIDSKERDRPNYISTGAGADKLDAGCFADETTWVGFEENLPPRFFQAWFNKFPREFQEQYVRRKHDNPRHHERVLSVVVTIVCIVFVCVTIFALLGLRAFLNHTYGTLVSGIIVGPSITIFTQLGYWAFNKIARWLTERQNWRKQSSWDNSFVGKIFLFQFVTGYSPYIFIITVKAWELEFTAGAAERCLPAVPNGPPNCMYDLNYALFSIFVFQVLLGNVQENIIPYVKHKFQKWRMVQEKKREAEARGLGLSDALAEIRHDLQLGDEKVSMRRALGATLAEAKRNSFPSDLFEDYAELMLQFGYVTMFAAGFPLSSALALLNNLVEIRSDMFKYLRTMQRPFPTMSQGIGVWNTVLFGMSTAAVISNTFILCFVSNTMNEYFVGFASPTLAKVIVMVIVEHLVLLGQLLIHLNIHAVPKSVRVQAALTDSVETLEKKAAAYVSMLAPSSSGILVMDKKNRLVQYDPSKMGFNPSLTQLVKRKQNTVDPTSGYETPMEDPDR
eukprot:tig00021617_g22939.t1